MEYISRFYIGGLLLCLINVTYTNQHVFTAFILFTFLASILELILLPKKYLQYTRLIMLINYLSFVNIIYHISLYKQITRIIIYNSVSDIIQYIVGKSIGKQRLFSFTSKSLEGYIAGIIATQMIFNYDYYFVLLNMIGMCGGIFSSIIKRRLKIKHWSNLLGPHGGINDRLDSLCVPIIIYLNFIK